MSDSSDTSLLNAWRRDRDRTAMNELVLRHIHFVYSAARRMLRDPVIAEDVTQAVFMLLIQKSPRVPSREALVVWLHRTTRYACANARRVRARQEQRDRREGTSRIEAGNPMDAIKQIDDSDERQRMLPLLDEAITQLGPRDRNGVLLCYFYQRTYREIAATLGTTEAAARKRVERAVDRMRDFFASRGVVTASATITACLLHQSTLTAPPALAAAAANIATISQLALASSTYAPIVHAVTQTMLITKMKVAAALVAGLLIAGATTGVAIHEVYANTSNVATTRAPDSQYHVDGGGTQIDFIGVSECPPAQRGWLSLDGAEIDPPQSPFHFERHNPRDATHHVMVRVEGTGDFASVAGEVSDAVQDTGNYVLDGGGQVQYWLFCFTPKEGKKTVDLELLVADGEWKRLVEGKSSQPGRALGSFKTELGGIAFTHVMESQRGGGSMIYVASEPIDQAWRISAVDTQGGLHPAFNINGEDVGKLATCMAEFDVPVDQVASVVIDTRPFNKKIVVKHITLDRANRTKPEIDLTEIPEKGK